ncbi:MAG: hypothetical protein IT326_06670 [Anaerolineae bacterium]|nr:hypothetical protein [Anaerolineae bacterium]
MTTVSLEEQIRPFSNPDGQYDRLLDFMRENAALLAPGFEPPLTPMPDEPVQADGRGERRTLRWGDGGQGFEVTHYTEPAAGLHLPNVDELRLRPFGLPDGIVFEFECTRRFRTLRVLTLRLTGPEPAAKHIAEEVRRRFG